VTELEALLAETYAERRTQKENMRAMKLAADAKEEEVSELKVQMERLTSAIDKTKSSTERMEELEQECAVQRVKMDSLASQLDQVNVQYARAREASHAHDASLRI
jgi:multidrug resistance efflux pump